ncbi:diphthine--ammonia ligase [Halobacillus sp. A5]|uniref:Dph6-related ATP pyrophosphatase n=1 Tax=Halobacillus sp. A5 TaxID=2880263 RepID=UPI0020A6C739|nr:diphthine--ammonia ligase [Halobacillus sp. A5]MCP3028893.1 diphthine--ammonia ligase [Halobacillus sp. A5]
MKELVVSWSGGKDSAFALYQLINNNEYKVRGLLSSTSLESARLPIHEVTRELIHSQAEALGCQLYEVQLPAAAGNEKYELEMGRQFKELKGAGINAVAYADLFLEDIKEYREGLLQRLGMSGVYPLWKKDTAVAANQFIDAGFEAVVTTVDTDKLSEEFVGRNFTKEFLSSLPGNVDPCGENGEFHTFVFNGPIFKKKVEFTTGEIFHTFAGRFAHYDLNK